MTLHSKTAIVTGGRRGIGRALAMALHEAGARVIVIAKSADRGDLPKEIDYIQADLSKPEERKDIIPPCDILINNAAVSLLKPALEIKDEEWELIISLNLTAVFALSCQAMLKGCKRIINIGSISSFAGARNISAYATTKHGLIGLTKCLSNEWALYDVTVNCIAPGFIKTDMSDPVSVANNLTRIPVGRVGQPQDIIGAMLLLVSDEASYITGTTIVVDGGWLAR